MNGAKDPPLKGEARLDAQGDVGLSVDILIVGAGLVGLSLAAALQGSGLRIMCVDAQTAPTPPEHCFEARPVGSNQEQVQGSEREAARVKGEENRDQRKARGLQNGRRQRIGALLLHRGNDAGELDVQHFSSAIPRPVRLVD